MAIKVGQIRKNGNQSYISDINHELTTFPVSGIGGKIFSEFAISGNFQADINYYVRVLIKRLSINEDMGSTTGAGDNDPHNLNIDVKLYPDNSENSTYQTIGETLLIGPYLGDGTANQDEESFFKWCEACISDGNPSIDDNQHYPGAHTYYSLLKSTYDAQHDSNNNSNTNDSINIPYQTVELVFTPYVNSTRLVFQLRRVNYDYIAEQPRVVDIVKGVRVENGKDMDRDVTTITNILPRTANKIGIQSRPGSLVTVNKEPMRIGKSGTLEINNGIVINSVGMVAPSNEVNEFILDYTYNA